MAPRLHKRSGGLRARNHDGSLAQARRAVEVQMTQGDLARVVKDVFSRYRSRIAVQTLAGRQYCYGDLDQMSQRFAIQLRAGRGDRVVALVDKSPEALILYLACLRAGAVFVPLNPALPPDELTFFLADAEPTRVVCAPRLEDAVRSSLPNVGSTVVRTLDDQGGGSLFGCPPNPLPSPAAGARASEDLPSEAAAFLYTSGTTGRSKGAVLTQANLESNGWALCRAWGFSTQDVLLHALPLFHVHGLFVACHCALLAGARMLFLPRFNLQEVLTALPHCTVLMGVPTYYSRLLAAGLNQRQLGRMRLWISGSAPLHEDVFATFAEQTGQEILERYGMTETLITTSNPLRGPRRPGSVGPAVQGVDVTVVSDSEMSCLGDTSVRWRSVGRACSLDTIASQTRPRTRFWATVLF